MLPTSYEEIGNWGLPVVEDEPVTAFKQCMSINWRIKSLQVPPTTTSRSPPAKTWKLSVGVDAGGVAAPRLLHPGVRNFLKIFGEIVPWLCKKHRQSLKRSNCWGKNHLRVIDLVLLVLLIRLSLDTAEDWACRAGDPWLPCRGSRVWWTELWLHLFTKHLHDGGYVGQSWPTAKSLKHKSVLTILTALTLLHKSYLGHRGKSRNGLCFKRNFQGKSESEMKSWPVTPKELCALPGPSWKAGQVLLSHFAVIGFIIIFLM